MTEITLERIVVACVTALPPTLMALAAFKQGRANNRQSIEQAKQVEVTAATLADKVKETAHDLAAKVNATSDSIETKTSALLVKADEIHTLANSNLTKVKEQLASALDRIEELEKTISQMLPHA